MVAAALARRGVASMTRRRIALSDGPGSFTGLRVAPRSPRRWSRRAGLPSGSRRRCWSGPRGVAGRGALVLAVADALRGEVYAAAYRFDPERMYRARALGAAAGGPGRERASRPALLVGDLPAAVATRWSVGSGRPTGRSAATVRRSASRCWVWWRAGGARRLERSVVGAGLRSARGGPGTLGDGPWTPPTGSGRQSRLTRRARRPRASLLQRSVERGQLPRGAGLGLDLRAGRGERGGGSAGI